MLSPWTRLAPTIFNHIMLLEDACRRGARAVLAPVRPPPQAFTCMTAIALPRATLARVVSSSSAASRKRPAVAEPRTDSRWRTAPCRPRARRAPGREWIKANGITFTNHQAASCVCSPARSTLFTGLHISHTGVFDNANALWQPDMSTNLKTVGHRLAQLGYHAAYQGSGTCRSISTR